jgi:predicted HicB family RNase H-like nuclease
MEGVEIMGQKKNFKENPALQFISTPTDNTDSTDNTSHTDNTVTKRKTNNAQYKHSTHKKHSEPGNSTDAEMKTKRINLILQPSIVDDLSKIAYMKKNSINNLVNTILKDYAKEESMTIVRYNEVFNNH